MPKSIDFNKLTFIELEWIIIMIAMGYAFLKSELAYENTGMQRYIYITFFCFMIFIYSLKKLHIVNVFNLINKSIQYAKSGYKFMINDYNYWRLNNVRRK